jgi:hypothetical protein
VETGSGMSFSLTGRYLPEFSQTPHSELAFSLYGDNKAMITEMAKRSKDYYALVENARIAQHRMLAPQVFETVFDNGVRAVVNYSAQDFDAGGKTVKARGFIYEK